MGRWLGWHSHHLSGAISVVVCVARCRCSFGGGGYGGGGGGYGPARSLCSCWYTRVPSVSCRARQLHRTTWCWLPPPPFFSPFYSYGAGGGGGYGGSGGGGYGGAGGCVACVCVVSFSPPPVSPLCRPRSLANTHTHILQKLHTGIACSAWNCIEVALTCVPAPVLNVVYMHQLRWWSRRVWRRWSRRVRVWVLPLYIYNAQPRVCWLLRAVFMHER